MKGPFQMNTVRTHKTLFSALLLGILMSSMTPTKLQAIDFASLITNKRLAIVVPFTVVLLACSDNARKLTTQAYYKSKIAAFKMLKQLPLSSNTQQKYSEIIDETDAQCTKRSGENFSGENLKNLLKDFKEMIDIFKNGKELLIWLDFIPKA